MARDDRSIAGPSGRARRAARLLLLAAAAATTQRTGAQPPASDVGRVDDVKRLGALQGCDSVLVAPGPSGVWIRRGARAGPTSAARGEPVRVDDALYVNAVTDVRLRVESTDLGRGTLYLAPSLFCNARVRRDTVVGRLTRVTRGAGYALAAGASAAGAPPRSPNRRLELAVDSGAVIVQWHGGPDHPLIVRAAGHRIPVTGTDLAVHADHGGQEAILYLQTGVVGFEQYPGIVVNPGEMYWLRRGLPPVGLSGAALLQPAMQHHARSVWQRFWQKPAFWVWTGLAAGAAAACAVACPSGSDSPTSADGTVIVRFPF